MVTMIILMMVMMRMMISIKKMMMMLVATTSKVVQGGLSESTGRGFGIVDLRQADCLRWFSWTES